MIQGTRDQLDPQTLGWSRFHLSKGHVNSPSQKGHENAELPGDYEFTIIYPLWTRVLATHSVLLSIKIYTPWNQHDPWK